MFDAVTIHDKHSMIEQISRLYEEREYHLELGCGSKKRSPDAIGIDQLDYPCVDIVGDIGEVLAQLPDRSISTVSAFHTFEHFADFTLVLRRVEAVMKIGGLLEIVVPHFSNPYFYSDYTHKQFFGLYTFSYLAEDKIFKRRVPNYGRLTGLRLKSVSLAFKSSPPFYIRHGLKRIFGSIVNSCRATKELYEELACWLIPCYEIHYILERYK